MEPIPKEVVFYQNKQGKKPFQEWLDALDSVTRSRIEQRIIRLSLGLYGDVKLLQNGVKELRFHFGPGYRLYFGQERDRIVVLLNAGDKNTQKKDIVNAIIYWKDYCHD